MIGGQDMIETGQTLNDTYEITERLGSGAGGIIYKAYHRRMRKYVAIKLIKEDLKNTLDTRAEVDMLKDLKNDYLPQVIDFVEDGSDVYTVMEFIDGKDFKYLVENGRTFDEKSVRKYAVQLCEAVNYLHSHHPPIIHSDIKPANLMLTMQDNICLIDFNISTLSRHGAAAAKGGSRGFAAPEQFRRLINPPASQDAFHEQTRFMTDSETEILTEENVSASSQVRTKDMARAYIDIRTDIYGIGATLYYILTGRVPLNGKTDFRGVNVSKQLADVINKAMSADPEQRFENAAQMEEQLSGNRMRSVYRIAAVSAVLIVLGVMGVSAFSGRENDKDVPTEYTEQSAVQQDESTDTFAAPAVQEDNDVLEYFPNGAVKCKKTLELVNGGYELTWFEEDGARDIVEVYDKSDQLILVRLYDSMTGELMGECEPEFTEGGYFLTRAAESKDYSIIKEFKDSERVTRKMIYCDENGKELFWRTYEIEYGEDSRRYIWYDSDGLICQEQEYFYDGSEDYKFYRDNKIHTEKRVDADGTTVTYYYEDGKLSFVKTVYNDGTEKTDYYDENGNITKTVTG